LQKVVLSYIKLSKARLLLLALKKIYLAKRRVLKRLLIKSFTVFN